MGTKIEFDNCLPGYYSMRDLTLNSNAGNWSAYNGENGFRNGQYYYGFLSRGISDSHPGYEKDFLKQTMLEHEAIFKNQVYELHRLYQVQRVLMDEFKRKEGCMLQTPYETSSSSSPLPSQIPSAGPPKWNSSSFPLGNSISSKPHVPSPAIVQTSPYENKGKSLQVGPIPYRSCSSPKDSTSESRPSKHRRKIIDLQLPADEYIDTDEVQQCGEANHPDTNNKSGAKSGEKLYLGCHEKIDINSNGMPYGSSPKKSSGLADLNEPLLLVEPSSYPPVEFPSITMPRDGSSLNFLGPSRGMLQNFQHGSINGISDNCQHDNKGDGRGWFSYIRDAEQSSDKLRSIHPSPQLDKLLGPFPPVQFLCDSMQNAPGHYPSDYSKGDSWRTKTSGERNYFSSSYNNSVSFLPAEGPAPSPFSQSSDLVNSWVPSVLPWGKSSNLISPKSMSVQPNACMIAATSSKSSVPSNDLFWNRGLSNTNLGANHDYVSEMSVINGFYRGSSSGSKEVLDRFHLVNIGSVNDGVDERALGSGDFFRTSLPHSDMNFKKDLNLNIGLSNGFHTYQNSRPPLKIMDRGPKIEDRHPAPPWLTGMGACSKEAASPRKALNSGESALPQIPSELFSNHDLKKVHDRLNSLASTSHNCTRHMANDCLTSRMILGVPISERSLASKNEGTSSVRGPSHGLQPSWDEEIGLSSRKAGFDINMPYNHIDSDKTAADEVVLRKKLEGRGAGLRDHIDLNSRATESDVPSGNANVRCVVNIDLEAPVCLDSEDDNFEVGSSKRLRNLPMEVHQHRTKEMAVAKLARAAAEAIVDISASVIQKHVIDSASPQIENSSDNPLLWFADVVSSCEDVYVNHPGVDASRDVGVQEDIFSSESGHFESMTLKLTECDGEEYLSKPSEVLKVEGTGSIVSGTRPRRGGQVRRGRRQRRDFQRDILPGLVSLSRHEVTEDLQTFGGLMKATGHTWHSGLRRNAVRNACARGRRRRPVAAPCTPPPRVNTVCALLKQQLSNVTSSQVRLEDRSLTGWGMTTRRPRRQRFPAGNAAAAT